MDAMERDNSKFNLKNTLDQKFFGKWIPLNEKFFIIRKRDDVGSFDMQPDSEQQLTDIGLYVLAVDALRKLGRMLDEGEQYKEISRIACTSWIGTLNPRALEFLGFHIDKDGTDPLGQELIASYKAEDKLGWYPLRPEHKNIKPTFASMDREEFLGKYGSSREQKL